MRTLCLAVLLAIGLTGCDSTEPTEESSRPQETTPSASAPALEEDVPVYRVRVDGDTGTSQPDELSLLKQMAEAGNPTLTQDDLEKLSDMIASQTDGPGEKKTVLILVDDSMSMSLPDPAAQPAEQPKRESVKDMLLFLSDGTPNTPPATQEPGTAANTD